MARPIVVRPDRPCCPPRTFPVATPDSASAGFTAAFVPNVGQTDPAVQFQTSALGGTASDTGAGIAVNTNGDAFVTGSTFSSNFPTTSGAFQENDRNSTDAFVTRLTPSGNVAYSTYLGGDGTDEGYAVAVDADDNAYLTGITTSSDFVPAGSPGFQTTYAGKGDAFITKLTATGSSASYSTYLGGNGLDRGTGIALDADRNAYIVGDTDSSASTFPLQNPRQSGLGGNSDAFISKLNPAGDALLYSTYHGGSGTEYGKAIAVDGDRQMYITGRTTSTSASFPLFNPLQNAVQNTDAFVSKLNAAGSAFVFSTYLGGSAFEEGTGIAVDRFGQAHVTGYTSSSDFPATATLPELAAGGTGIIANAFVATYHPLGRALMHSSTLSGGDTDQGAAIAVGRRALETPDPDKSEPYYVEGINHVTGYTGSSNFPTYNAQDATLNGYGYDGFVTKLAPYPAGTTSYYMTTVDPTTLYNRGKLRGERDRDRFGTQDSMVVLFFGSPATDDATDTISGTIHFNQEYVEVSEIATAAQEFGRGYVEGSEPEDTTSQLTLAISTSNDGPVTTRAHGEVWAEMVKDVQQWFADNGYAGRVTAVGASNIELNWNTSTATRSWVDGYLSVADIQELYNFGAIEGCPPAGGQCDNGWQESDIWYVSWGAAPFKVFAIPQIYANSGINAQQWQEIAFYSTIQPGGLMQFRGALTQYQACADRPDYPGVCTNADQIPEEGWRYLWTELNDSPNTRQPLRWSTDVRWEFPVEEY